MKFSTKLLILFIILGTGVILTRMIRASQSISSIPNTPATQAAYEKKENEGGNVTVSVTPLTLRPGFPPSFDIAFETHSVDLAFDVEQIALLSDKNGTIYTAVWSGSPPGGHHRSGTLRFTPDLPRPGAVTLTLSDIAGIAERSFNWEVKNP